MELARTQRVASLACAGLILAVVTGCATPGRLAEIDAKYDRILAVDCGGSKQVCGLQEQNRLKEKEYANSPMHRLRNWLGMGGGGTGSSTSYIYIVN
jgi:hypothetical protein